MSLNWDSTGHGKYLILLSISVKASSYTKLSIFVCHASVFYRHGQHLDDVSAVIFWLFDDLSAVNFWPFGDVSAFITSSYTY